VDSTKILRDIGERLKTAPALEAQKLAAAE
jgi:penicillin-binding protein 1A